MMGAVGSDWGNRDMSVEPVEHVVHLAHSHGHLGVDELRQVEERIRASVARKREVHLATREAVERQTFGQRMADAVANGMGSWPFLIIQSILLAIWMILNLTEVIWKAWDPYPFILLNLALSCQAAYAAPIIMMSQNRQAAKDRADARRDLEADLHAEAIIEEVHGQVDDLRLKKWTDLLTIQQQQIQMLSSLVDRLLPESTNGAHDTADLVDSR